MANIQFKSDNQNQSVLFPSRLDENIPAIHPVRIVNEIVDKLDIRDLLSEYKGVSGVSTNDSFFGLVFSSSS